MEMTFYQDVGNWSETAEYVGPFSGARNARNRGTSSRPPRSIVHACTDAFLPLMSGVFIRTMTELLKLRVLLEASNYPCQPATSGKTTIIGAYYFWWGNRGEISGN